MPKRPIGRPPKLNPEVQAKIVSAIKIGNYIETAAAYAGVDKTTVYDWLKKGARGQKKSAYTVFANAVEEAMAEAEIRDVANISKAAASGTWAASAWRLERKFPDRWGRTDRSKLEVTGKDGGAVQVEGSWSDIAAAAKRIDDDDDKE